MDEADRRSWPRRFRDAAWRPVHAGESGALVVRNDRAGVHAKVVASGSRDELAAERDRTQWLRNTGFPCPAVLDWEETDHHVALLLSTVAGVPASTLAPVERPAAAAAIAAALRDLHALPPAACPFTRPLELVLAQARAVVEHGAVVAEFLAPGDTTRDPVEVLAELEVMATTVTRDPLDQVVCHGDACLPNIMVDPTTLRCTGVLDLGRLGVSDRYSDLALLAAQVGDEWPEVNVDALSAPYGLAGLDPERLTFYRRIDGLTWRSPGPR